MKENRVVRMAIAAMLMSVPGIGRVHEYERYAKTDKDFRRFYLSAGAGASDSDSLHGWHIRRIGRVEKGNFNLVETKWEIRGFLALNDDDASELEFDDLVDDILDAFRDDPTLGNVVQWPALEAEQVPTVTDSGPAMFGGVLCHCVKLQLVTNHTIDDAPKSWS